ncbi:glycosyltransferase family protein [Streptococcus lactarius]|uniref:hypothetical protein n=1 Tax=Streptococcus lactarius TaxID=684066 RepID=UPI00360CE8BC
MKARFAPLHAGVWFYPSDGCPGAKWFLARWGRIALSLFFRPAKRERGRYFNEVPVPDFWEISGDNSSGKVNYYGQEKARIAYHAASYKRIVESVEWLDDKGQVVMIERYDQYGRKIAVTTCDAQGHPLVTTYFEGDTERLTENHQTGDLILTLANQPMRIFKNRIDYFVFI